MKKLLLLFSFVTCIFLNNHCLAGLHDYPNIAVLPYANKAAVSQEISLADASMVSEFVIEQLVDSGRFSVIEREQMLAIMQEMNLSNTGMVSPMSMVQIGNLSGAQYMLVGSITGLSTKVSGAEYQNSVAGGVGGNKNTVIANVTARIFEVETGRIVLAASGTGASSSSNVEFKLNKTKTTTTETTGSTADGEEFIQEGQDVSTVTHTIKIGSYQFSQVQVRNALYKAVNDLVNGKYGLIAKLDGNAKKRKV